MGLFSEKKKDPKEEVNSWCGKIRKEGYQLDRQIRAIEREKLKVEQQLRLAAKKNEPDVCKILAKEIVHARKAISRIHATKAELNSVQLGLKNQLAMLRVSGALQQSTQVMQSVQKLISVPEVQKSMMELSREMMKMGVIEEMMEDTMESVTNDDEELEEETANEVNKILFELTSGVLGQMPDVGTSTLAPSEAEAPNEEESNDLDVMQKRLEVLRS